MAVVSARPKRFTAGEPRHALLAGELRRLFARGRRRGTVERVIADDDPHVAAELEIRRGHKRASASGVRGARGRPGGAACSSCAARESSGRAATPRARPRRRRCSASSCSVSRRGSFAPGRRPCGWYGHSRGSNPAVPCAPLRRGCGGRSRRPGRSSLRRHRTGAARSAPPSEPVQRRPPDPSRQRGGGRARSSPTGARAACSSRNPSPRTGGSRRTTRGPTACAAAARDSSLRCASSRTRTASSSRTSSRTRGRRRGACACSARRARSSSRSSSSGTARSTSTGSASRISQSGGDSLWRLDPEFGEALTEELRGRAAPHRRRAPPLRDDARRRRGVAARGDRPDRAGGSDDLPHAPACAIGRRGEGRADQPSG